MSTIATVEYQPQLHDMFEQDQARFLVAEIGKILNDAVVIQRASGDVVWHNDVACRHLRMSSSQLLGASSLDPNWRSIRLDGSDYPGDQHPAMRTLRSGMPIQDDIMGIRVGDGALRWLRIDTTPVHIEAELHVIVVFEDITNELENSRALRGTLDELQARLVPEELPTIDGIRFARSYTSVGMTDSIGGDFFGSHVDGPGDLSFFIGDVCGHGVGSAGLSSMARTFLCAVGPLVADPGQILDRLHTAVLEERPDTFLSAVHGRVRCIGGRYLLTVASGGHPLPILLRDGDSIRLGEAGSLVGMVENSPRPTWEYELYPGDRVVMWTDGITDGVRPRLSDDQLLERIPTNLSIDGVLEMLERLADAFSSDVSDDAAVLGFEVTG